MNHIHIFETTVGFCGISWGEKGISGFRLPGDGKKAIEHYFLHRLSHVIFSIPSPLVQQIITSVEQYFSGRVVDFSGVPVDIDDQKQFAQLIYVELRRVGWGKTTTYGALARALGAGPKAAQNVGRVMARNPIPLIIPCHRVLTADGKIGGFSAPGGPVAKMRMLELEGVFLKL